MNITEMRATVRRDLHDEDAAGYRWTDDEIDRHITRAVKEYSGAAPDEQTAVQATTAGSRALDVSGLAGLVMVEAVEYPAGEFPPRYRRFALWGGTLTVLDGEVPDGGDASIFYGRLHTLDDSGSTVPARHEDLIALGAAGHAAIAWGLYAVNRVNLGGTGTAAALLAWGEVRVEVFRTGLKMVGRKGGVRVSTLYPPA